MIPIAPRFAYLGALFVVVVVLFVIGWFLPLEATDDEDPSNVIIMLACSKECALALFNKGPGPRWTIDPSDPTKLL